MIAVVDYGSGNVAAICNIYKQRNIPFFLASQPEDLLSASKIILPGVGAFDRTMKLLNISGLTESLNFHVQEKKIPILGICVGMQIMGNSSDEGAEAGLGWIKGHVRRFDTSVFTAPPYLPHMGWDTVVPVYSSPLFRGVSEVKEFYFLHSYYFDCEDKANVLAKTSYYVEFASAVTSGNVFGVQFHPEKSHANGICVLMNFAEM